MYKVHQKVSKTHYDKLYHISMPIENSDSSPSSLRGKQHSLTNDETKQKSSISFPVYSPQVGLTSGTSASLVF